MTLYFNDIWNYGFQLDAELWANITLHWLLSLTILIFWIIWKQRKVMFK